MPDGKASRTNFQNMLLREFETEKHRATLSVDEDLTVSVHESLDLVCLELLLAVWRGRLSKCGDTSIYSPLNRELGGRISGIISGSLEAKNGLITELDRHFLSSPCV